MSRLPNPSKLAAHRARSFHDVLPKSPGYQKIMREAAREYDEQQAREKQMNGKKGGRPKKLRPLIVNANGKAA